MRESVSSELNSGKNKKTMKKLLVTLAAVLVSVSTFAQGTVNFQNFVPNVVNAPVWAPGGTGTTGAGSLNAMAQLFRVEGTGASAVYTPVGQASAFRAATAGNPVLNAYVVGNNVMDTGLAAGSSVTLVLRAWVGANYDDALTKGQSPNSVTVTLGGQIDPTQPAATPPTLAGLQGFELQVVPEPSTIALGVLGAAALLYRRRS